MFKWVAGNAAKPSIAQARCHAVSVHKATLGLRGGRRIQGDGAHRIAERQLTARAAACGAEERIDAIDLGIAPEALRERGDVQHPVAAATRTARPEDMVRLALEARSALWA